MTNMTSPDGNMKLFALLAENAKGAELVYSAVARLQGSSLPQRIMEDVNAMNNSNEVEIPTAAAILYTALAEDELDGEGVAYMFERVCQRRFDAVRDAGKREEIDQTLQKIGSIRRLHFTE